MKCTFDAWIQIKLVSTNTELVFMAHKIQFIPQFSPMFHFKHSQQLRKKFCSVFKVQAFFEPFTASNARALNNFSLNTRAAFRLQVLIRKVNSNLLQTERFLHRKLKSLPNLLFSLQKHKSTSSAAALLMVCSKLYGAWKRWQSATNSVGMTIAFSRQILTQLYFEKWIGCGKMCFWPFGGRFQARSGGTKLFFLRNPQNIRFTNCYEAN